MGKKYAFPKKYIPARNDIAVSNARLRVLRSRNGIIGRGALYSTYISTGIKSTPRTRRTITTGESHAKVDPPLEMGTRIRIVEVNETIEPIKSTFLSFCLKEPVTGFRGRKNRI